MQRLLTIALGLALTAGVAACNSNSDAVRVLEAKNISLEATISAYETAAPTMTAQATAVAQRIATLQIALTAAQSTVKAVMAKSNSETQSTTQIEAPAGSTPGAVGTESPGGPTGFAFADVTTAKGIDDSNGCAVNKTTTFAITDQRVYVVADVRNYKIGTSFTAKWSGGDLNKENSWKAPRDGKQICIYFYIEPKTLGLKAGTYNVTISATGLTSTPVQFTMQ